MAWSPSSRSATRTAASSTAMPPARSDPSEWRTADKAEIERSFATMERCFRAIEDAPIPRRDGRLLNATKAQHAGLVTRVASDPEVDRVAVDIARQLAHLHPAAARVAKETHIVSQAIPCS